MKQEINPQDSNRAEAFSLWMSSLVPMVTLVKTFDVTRLVKLSKKSSMRSASGRLLPEGRKKFNMLMCWCIGKAAKDIKEFYILPMQDKLYKFDQLAINIVVQNVKGGINLCDVPLSDDIRQFNADYLELTSQAAQCCKSTSLEDYMIVGTSTLPQTELDCIVNQYSGRYNNPFIAWGKYRKGFLKTTLPISFQFHHVQMDGGHAAHFLENLQNVINTV